MTTVPSVMESPLEPIRSSRELSCGEGLQRGGPSRLEADADLFYLLGRKRLVEQAALIPAWVAPAAFMASQVRAGGADPEGGSTTLPRDVAQHPLEKFDQLATETPG